MMITTDSVHVLEAQVRAIRDSITRVEILYYGKTELNLAVVRPDGRGGEIRSIVGTHRQVGLGQPRKFGSLYGVRVFLGEHLPNQRDIRVVLCDGENESGEA